MHHHLHMPTLHGPSEKTYYLAGIKVGYLSCVHHTYIDPISQNVRLVLNVQHDCERCGCEIGDVKVEIQEREATTNTVQGVIHTDDDHFIVNVHSLHNPQVNRGLFKAEFYAPPSIHDRQTLHHNLAAIIRENEKKKAATRKSKMTLVKATNSNEPRHQTSNTSKRKTVNVPAVSKRRRTQKQVPPAGEHPYENVWQASGDFTAAEQDQPYHEHVWDPNESESSSNEGDGGASNGGYDDASNRSDDDDDDDNDNDDVHGPQMIT